MTGAAASPAGTVSDTTAASATVPANARPVAAGRAEWVVLGGVLLVIAFVRLRLLHLPLERDEGEFAYGGQLLLRGVPPFVHLYAMKLPGIYAAYALPMAVFGQSLAGVRLGILLVHLASTVLLFVLTRRHLGGLAAAIAATVWAVAAMSPDSLGMAGHATHFVVAFALGGLLALPSRPTCPARYFLAGLLLGLAFAMKQSGAAFAAFGGVLLLWQVWTDRREAGEPRRPSPLLRALIGRLALYAAGVFLPVGLLYAYLYASGVWELAYFWNFIYAREYASLVPADVGATFFARGVERWSLPYRLLWLAALAGLTSPFWSASVRSARGFVWGLFLFGCLAVVPGLYFRPHYFLQALPGVALACGMLAVGLADRLPLRRRPAVARLLAGGLAALPALALLAVHRVYFFTAAPDDACRITYFQNPFPESLPIAEYLRKNTAPGDRIAVLGSEPQIFFYSGRDSATGHVYMYPLMEEQKYARAMQEQMIAEVEGARPRHLVLISNTASWTEGPWSIPRLREWIAAYRKDFTVVAVADQMRHPDGRYETRYAWDEDARGYRPESPFFVAVLRRRDAP